MKAIFSLIHSDAPSKKLCFAILFQMPKDWNPVGRNFLKIYHLVLLQIFKSMRILIQNVKEAAVRVDETVVGKIGKGLLVFLGVHRDDTVDDCLWLKEKLIHLRIFMDANEKMNLSIQDVAGELLIVSQFTLYADCIKGRRPSFDQSARPELAKELYERFVDEMRTSIKTVQTGQFGAYMQVQLINDGPLTFWIDSKQRSG
jgi:D-tyrosyl-tRNA(Tyr) deacylase